MNKIDSFKIYQNIFVAIGFAFVMIGFSQNTLAQIGGGAILSIDEPATGVAGGGSSKNVKTVKTTQTGSASASAAKGSKSKNSKSTTVSSKNTSPKSKTLPRGTPKPDSGFVIGDKYSFLNGEISEPVRPVFTLKAKQAGAIGLVQVEVLIDENGNVIQARARTGNVLLHPEAEKAALETKFNKPNVYGKPAKALGFIVFRFGRPEDDPENN